MYYYQVVCKRPFSNNYSHLGDLTYSAIEPIALGSRVMVELGSSLIRGVVVAETSKDVILNMHTRNITIKEIQSVLDKNSTYK